MGFDQMAVGIGVLTIIVAMTLIVLSQVASIENVGWVWTDASNHSKGVTELTSNDTIQAGITGLSLYGNFFSIIVILGIFVGIIGLLYMVTRGTGQNGA